MEERLIDKFLKEYVQDLVECSSDEYELTEEQIMDVVTSVEDNEHAWEGLNEAIFQEIGQYIKEGEPYSFDKQYELERIHNYENN